MGGRERLVVGCMTGTSVDGLDAAGPIRTQEVTSKVSAVSAVPEVRTLITELQRSIAAEAAREATGIVVEGRDIGTTVLPDADLKVFLTASVETRARRRASQMGRPGRLETYQREITARDRTDSTREVAPLRRAPGALVLDTGELDVDGCVAAILDALPGTEAP